MASIQKFDRKRLRGIVWVCDIAQSSKYLNRDDAAEPTEEFLQRFLYLSLIAVDASDGEFIKWTGDGFMAWYEAPLDRAIGDIAARIFRAAWELSFYVNVTQLAVDSPVKFRIRHAVTYEKDALVIDLQHSGTMVSRDVLGRSVVLAFRISSLSGTFPSIVTQRELVNACKNASEQFRVSFKMLRLSKEDRLRYFKGESWGTKNLCVSAESPSHVRRTIHSVMRQARKALNKYGAAHPSASSVPEKIAVDMLKGPPWCHDVVSQIEKYIRGELVPALKGALDAMQQMATKSPGPSTPK
jgi:class 3 adenylate cyclase